MGVRLLQNGYCSANAYWELISRGPYTEANTCRGVDNLQNSNGKIEYTLTPGGENQGSFQKR